MIIKRSTVRDDTHMGPLVVVLEKLTISKLTISKFSSVLQNKCKQTSQILIPNKSAQISNDNVYLDFKRKKNAENNHQLVCTRYKYIICTLKNECWLDVPDHFYSTEQQTQTHQGIKLWQATEQKFRLIYCSSLRARAKRLHTAKA